MSSLPRLATRRTTVVAVFTALLAFVCVASVPVRAATFTILPATINPLAVGSPVNRGVFADCVNVGGVSATTSGALPAGVSFKDREHRGHADSGSRIFMDLEPQVFQWGHRLGYLLRHGRAGRNPSPDHPQLSRWRQIHRRRWWRRRRHSRGERRKTSVHVFGVAAIRHQGLSCLPRVCSAASSPQRASTPSP